MANKDLRSIQFPGLPDTYVVPEQGGEAGKDGITPTIGTNGNWYLGETDTGKPSRGATGATGPAGKDGAAGSPGANGITPEIGENGNWFLDGADTGKPSRGEKGETGAVDITAMSQSEYAAASAAGTLDENKWYGVYPDA